MLFWVISIKIAEHQWHPCEEIIEDKKNLCSGCVYEIFFFFFIVIVLYGICRTNEIIVWMRRLLGSEGRVREKANCVRLQHTRNVRPQWLWAKMQIFLSNFIDDKSAIILLIFGRISIASEWNVQRICIRKTCCHIMGVWMPLNFPMMEIILCRVSAFLLFFLLFFYCYFECQYFLILISFETFFCLKWNNILHAQIYVSGCLYGVFDDVFLSRNNNSLSFL